MRTVIFVILLTISGASLGIAVDRIAEASSQQPIIAHNSFAR
jgi:hypothetical protein